MPKRQRLKCKFSERSKIEVTILGGGKRQRQTVVQNFWFCYDEANSNREREKGAFTWFAFCLINIQRSRRFMAGNSTYLWTQAQKFPKFEFWIFSKTIALDAKKVFLDVIFVEWFDYVRMRCLRNQDHRTTQFSLEFLEMFRTQSTIFDQKADLKPKLAHIFLFTGVARVQEFREFLKRAGFSYENNSLYCPLKKTNCYDEKKDF